MKLSKIFQAYAKGYDRIRDVKIKKSFFLVPSELTCDLSRVEAYEESASLCESLAVNSPIYNKYSHVLLEAARQIRYSAWRKYDKKYGYLNKEVI